MKKKIKKKGLKKTNKALKRENKRLEEEREKAIYELAKLDDLTDEKIIERFKRNYGFVKRLAI